MSDLADQRLEIRGGRDSARLRIADQPLRHAALVDARHLGQRLHHLQPRDADPQFPGDELEEDQAFVERKLSHPSPEPRIALFLAERGQRKEALAHPLVERNLFARPALELAPLARHRAVLSADHDGDDVLHPMHVDAGNPLMHRFNRRHSAKLSVREASSGLGRMPAPLARQGPIYRACCKLRLRDNLAYGLTRSVRLAVGV